MGYVSELRALVGHRPLIVAGACLIIIDADDRVLLQHRVDNDLWGLPGGAMEIGETLEETARRELLEETGLMITKLRLLNVFSGHFYEYPNGDIIVNVTALYQGNDVRGNLLRSSKETKGCGYFGVKELPKVTPHDAQILDWYRNESERLTRA